MQLESVFGSSHIVQFDMAQNHPKTNEILLTILKKYPKWSAMATHESAPYNFHLYGDLSCMDETRDILGLIDESAKNFKCKAPVKWGSFDIFFSVEDDPWEELHNEIKKLKGLKPALWLLQPAIQTEPQRLMPSSTSGIEPVRRKVK